MMNIVLGVGIGAFIAMTGALVYFVYKFKDMM